MKVQFKEICVDNPQSLAIVKAILSNTGMGLKNSKDLYDNFRYYNTPTSIEIDDEKARNFIREVKGYGLICSGRKDVIKRLYKNMGEIGPDIDEIIEFMDCNFHITALNSKDKCRYMITDFDGFVILGMKYGEMWKTKLTIEDFEEYEINHTPYNIFYSKFYQK